MGLGVRDVKTKGKRAWSFLVRSETRRSYIEEKKTRGNNAHLSLVPIMPFSLTNEGSMMAFFKSWSPS